MKIAPVHRNNSYASRSRKASRGNNGRSWHTNHYADSSHIISIGGRSCGKGDHTPILTIVVIPSQTGPFYKKSGQHVNTHITDGLDEVISMRTSFDHPAPAVGNHHNNKLGCNEEDPIETLYKRVPPCNLRSEGLSSIDDRPILFFLHDIFIKLNSH